MEKIKKILIEYYGIENIVRIEKIEKKASHDFYKIVTKENEYFFKIQFNLKNKINSKYNLERKELFTILSSLKGVKINIPLKTKNGDFFVFEEIGDKVYSYYLFDFLEIDELSSNFSEKQRFEAIKNLALFHKEIKKVKKCKYLDKFNFLNYKSATAYHFSSYFYPKTPVELAKNSKSKFAKKVLENSEFIKDLNLEFFHYLSNINMDKPQLVHYDYNPGNVFFKNNKFLCISDFEYATMLPVQFDIIKAARFWSLDDSKLIDLDKYNDFIEVYRRYNDVEISNLTRYVLLLYLIIRRVVFAATMTLEKHVDLEFLFDEDIRNLKYLNKNKNIFVDKELLLKEEFS